MKYGWLKEAVHILEGTSNSNSVDVTQENRIWLAYRKSAQFLHHRHFWESNYVEVTMTPDTEGIVVLPWAVSAYPLYVLDPSSDIITGMSNRHHMYYRRQLDAGKTLDYHAKTPITTPRVSAALTSYNAGTRTLTFAAGTLTGLGIAAGHYLFIDGTSVPYEIESTNGTNTIVITRVYNDLLNSATTLTTENVIVEPSGRKRIDFHGTGSGNAYTIAYCRKFVPAVNDDDDIDIPAIFDADFIEMVHGWYQAYRSSGEARQEALQQAVIAQENMLQLIMKEIQPPNRIESDNYPPYSALGRYASTDASEMIYGPTGLGRENDDWGI